MSACTSCSATLVEGAMSCATCGVSVRLEGGGFTLVTRGPSASDRRLAKVFVTPEFTGRYELERAIGAGGMGMVFAARQVATGRSVAVKFVIGEDEEALARFEREALVLAKVSHPHVLRVIDYGVLDGHPYLVTELLPGHTLKTRLVAAGRFPLDESLRIGRTLLEALGACHAAGIIHRDVKPDNVLFDEHGSVKLADMGLARIQDAGRGLTGTGVVVGTPRYMPPEQIQGEGSDERSDLYSWACVFHQMIAGQSPFDGATPIELLRGHVAKPVPRLDGVPAALADLIVRVMAKDPAARPASAAALLAELDAAVDAPARPARASGRTSRPVSRPLSSGARSAPVTSPPAARGASPVALAAGAGAAVLVLALLAVPSRKGGEVTPVPRPTPVETVSAPAPAAPPALPEIPGLDERGAPGSGLIGRVGSPWKSHPGAYRIELSADGRRMATASEALLRVWDVAAGKLLREWRSPGGLVALPGDGARVLVARQAPQRALTVSLDVATGDATELAAIDAPPLIAVSAGGERLAYQLPDRSALRVVALAPGAAPETIPRAGPADAIALAAGGPLWIAHGVRLERWEPGPWRRAWEGPLEEPVQQLLAAEDGRHLAVVAPKAVALLDAADGRPRFRLPAPHNPRLAFARGARTLLVTGRLYGDTGKLWVIDVKAGTSRERPGAVDALAGHGDDAWFAAAGRFGRIAELGENPLLRASVPWLTRDGARAIIHRPPGFHLWQRSGGLRPLAPDGHLRLLMGVTPDERTAYFDTVRAHTAPASAAIVDLESGRVIGSLALPPASGNHVITPLDARGRNLESSWVGTLSLVEPGGKSVQLHPPVGEQGRGLLAAGRIAVLHVDRLGRIALIRKTTALGLLPVEAGAELRPITGRLRPATLLEDPVRVVSPAPDGRLHVWDESARSILRLAAVDGVPKWTILGASPDGTLVAGAFPGGLAVWDTRTGRLAARLETRPVEVTAIAVDAAARLVTTRDTEDVLAFYTWPREGAR